MNTVKEGQRWKERDARSNRIVVVVSVNEKAGRVAIRTLDPAGRVVPGRVSWAALARFNGRSGGYEFVQEAV